MQHGCWFRQVKNYVEPLLVSAKVAGYPNVLLGASGFSNFIKARYAPQEDWRLVWQFILDWLESRIELSPWQMAVRPSFSVADQLLATAEEQAFHKSVRWFSDHALSLHTELLVAEGVDSVIDHEGRQLPRYKTRGDCTGESALVFALDWKLNRNPASRHISGKIMDHLFNSPELCCLDSRNPCYGMLNFYENLPTFYGDDSCRAMLGCMISAELLDNTTWDRNILRCLLSCLRTTGPQGFRQTNLRWPLDFPGDAGWEYFQRTESCNYRPHSQAWMWAAYLLAWHLSGCREFLDSAREGISRLMMVYPDKIIWTNGFSQEIARMLLPLALLLRIENTAKHREMFKRIWRDIETILVDCGTVRETMGNLSSGMYLSPRCNEEYGTTEAALIQENGDPCCDLFYTVNFAFVGLHEAAMVTGEEIYMQAADRMAAFLTRVQAVSEQQPYLNGAWLRGFDWELWDYWGSSADNGWGAWSVETGWTNSWIASVFALRKLKMGLFDLVSPMRYQAILPELWSEMSAVHSLSDKSAIVHAAAPGVL